MNNYFSIGQVKRDISRLVNRVAFGEERIILTSRGLPKAALVSMDDYKKLQQSNMASLADWEEWKERAESLVAGIAKRRGKNAIDFAAFWEANRVDLEDRHAWIAGSD
ncbi:MAG: type II toxin-antitoxin system Phd/YefM family antitoxin [Chloroflexi bacterium]|nr:type II toxin-antitoxin system Phd/YefM family antitoxin [Chloroflexota bacterium]